MWVEYLFQPKIFTIKSQSWAPDSGDNDENFTKKVAAKLAGIEGMGADKGRCGLAEY